MTAKLLSWKFLIFLIAAVSLLEAVLLAYLFHEESKPYVGAIIVGRALGSFISLTLIMWLVKRRIKQTLTPKTKP